jgi:hypothetical protein
MLPQYLARPAWAAGRRTAFRKLGVTATYVPVQDRATSRSLDLGLDDYQQL